MLHVCRRYKHQGFAWKIYSKHTDTVTHNMFNFSSTFFFSVCGGDRSASNAFSLKFYTDCTEMKKETLKRVRERKRIIAACVCGTIQMLLLEFLLEQRKWFFCVACQKTQHERFSYSLFHYLIWLSKSSFNLNKTSCKTLIPCQVCMFW